MITRRITTTVEPVTLDQVKTLIPLTGTDFDARISAMIPALRMEAEQLTQRSLATSTWRLSLDAFPCGDCKDVFLRWPPIVSVQSVAYKDSAGATQTMPGGDYQLDIASEPGRLWPAVGKTWPSAYAGPSVINIDYTAGYGASAPDVVKLWIAARIRADINGCADEASRNLLNGMLDHLKVYG